MYLNASTKMNAVLLRSDESLSPFPVWGAKNSRGIRERASDSVSEQKTSHELRRTNDSFDCWGVYTHYYTANRLGLVPPRRYLKCSHKIVLTAHVSC